MTSLRVLTVPVALALSCLAACTGGGNDAAGPEGEAPPAASAAAPPAPPPPAPPPGCPATIPQAPGFEPPPPYPARPAAPNQVWYGTAELWTALDLDGRHSPRKSVWWSADFLGGREEGTPAISVTWRRLDAEEPPVVDAAPGTNAYTPEEGWWMIAGIDPVEPGCWEATATYRGVSLSYTFRVE